MRGIPAWLWLVAAGIYVVCPADFDFVPVLGWVDDAMVAYFAIQNWRKSVAARQTQVIEAQVFDAEIIDGQTIDRHLVHPGKG